MPATAAISARRTETITGMPRASRPALISKFDNRIPFLVDGTIHTVDKATHSRQTPPRRGGFDPKEDA